LPDDPSGLDQRWLRAAFNGAATRYDRAAVVQREVADRLTDRLDLIRLRPRQVTDIGCGTGYCTRALARRYPSARIYALDIAEAMLAAARHRSPRVFSRQHFACGDAQCLPLRSAAFDLVFSSLTLQWCSDLDGTFRELRRVCAPGGLLLFSTLGPDTLRELRESWAAADADTHVNGFLDLHDVGDALVTAGFADVVMDVDRITRTQPDVVSVMRELKLLGAHNVTRGRPRHLIGRGRLQRVTAAYEAQRRPDGLPVTYEVVYGHAWRPAAPGHVAVPFTYPGGRAP
jgi:malonyl-CoA O-methyltransferase